ncbi:hypothetical protein BCR44DRAFT_98137 [Catenaria anguillulae PL171]|uniref:Uncharacterized protein n=1 Tax=Catenaria anguillulae PL171 TaxID=765915 RepID=A0A1Y2HFY7_9FUNG|nr:hypothetical protein BCR44DRAFT_98137 [Catenaria anguillulae PL171]
MSVTNFLDSFARLDPLSAEDFESFVLASGNDNADNSEAALGDDDLDESDGEQYAALGGGEQAEEEESDVDGGQADIELFLDLEAKTRGRPRKTSALQPHRSNRQLAIKLPAGKAVSRITKSRSTAIGKGVTQDDRDTATDLVNKEIEKLNHVHLDPSVATQWTSVRGPPNGGKKVFLPNRIEHEYFYACAFDSCFTPLVHAIIDNNILGLLAAKLNQGGNTVGGSFGRILALFLEGRWDDMRFIWARDFLFQVYFTPSSVAESVDNDDLYQLSDEVHASIH